MWLPGVCVLLSIAVAAVAAWTDFRTGHIPNWLTFPVIPLGVVLNGLATLHGPRGFIEGALASLGGVLVCSLAPGLMFYKQLVGREGAEPVGGGGDVKLFAALGALLGYYHGIEAEFFAFCAAGIFGMASLAWHGRLLRAMGYTLFIAVNPVLPRKWRRDITPELLTKIRMGGAILAGTCVAALAR